MTTADQLIYSVSTFALVLGLLISTPKQPQVFEAFIFAVISGVMVYATGNFFVKDELFD